MPKAIATHRPFGSPEPRRQYERAKPRQEDKNFYSSARWIRLRDLVKAEEPLCRACLRLNRVSPTEHVDHILDRKQAPGLAFERANLQGLCKSCHNAKRKLPGCGSPP